MPDNTSKNGWRKHRFDEMAVMVNDRIDDPSEADVEYYVGLEHLDSDSLTIRRWGSPSDVEATKLRFRAGDIIFGRRRVYQRKLAVADFDGICSAHAMVLRAKPAVALQEFLPFFMQSDLFMERAKEISVGSLSPTINWKTLAKEEFALPPVEDQRRIVKVLGASAHLRAARQDLLTRCQDSFVSLLTTLALGRESTVEMKSSDLGKIPKHWELEPLRQLASFANGVSKPASAFGSGVPMVNLQDMFGRILLDRVPDDLVQVTEPELVSLSIRRHDILFVRSSVKPEGVGHAVMIDADWKDVVFAGFIIRCRIEDERIDPRFANYLFQERHFRRVLLSRSTVSLNTNINQQELGSMPVAIPPRTEQSRIIECLDLARSALDSAVVQTRQDAKLNKDILSTVLHLTSQQ